MGFGPEEVFLPPNQTSVRLANSLNEAGVNIMFPDVTFENTIIKNFPLDEVLPTTLDTGNLTSIRFNSILNSPQTDMPPIAIDDLARLASNPVTPYVIKDTDFVSIKSVLPSTSTLTPDSPSLPQSPSQISFSKLWDDFVAKPVEADLLRQQKPSIQTQTNLSYLDLLNQQKNNLPLENLIAEKAIMGDPILIFTKLSNPSDLDSINAQGFIGKYKISANNKTFYPAYFNLVAPQEVDPSQVYVIANKYVSLKLFDARSGNLSRDTRIPDSLIDLEDLITKGYDGVVRPTGINPNKTVNFEVVIFDGKNLKGQVKPLDSLLNTQPSTFSKVVDNVVANLTPTRLAFGAGTASVAIIVADIAFDFSDLGIRDQIIETGQNLWSSFLNLIPPENERGTTESKELGKRNEEAKKESDFGELVNENLTESQPIPDDCVNREILDTAVVGGNTGLRYNSSFEPDVVVVNDRIKGAEFSQFTDTWMVEEAVKPVQEWTTWINEQGYSPFISSAYRSYETQEAYSRSYEDEAATPGASCHQSGLCFDVHYYVDNKTGKRYDLCYDPNKPECKINLDAQVKAQELGIAHPYEWDQPHYFVAVAASPAILPFVQQQSTRVTYIDQLNEELLKLQDKCTQYTLP